MIQSPLVESLTARVDRLEQENRRLKQVGLIAGTLVGIGLLMGQAAPRHQVIQAQHIVITDDQGHERIVLGADKDRASILLKNEPGKATVVLALAAETAGLSVTDENAKHRLTLGKHLKEGGGAGLWLYDDQGNIRYSTTVNRTGPSLAVFDEAGKRIQ